MLDPIIFLIYISDIAEFNEKKFQVVRYGPDSTLKHETTYFTGDYEEIFDRFSTVRDLDVQLSDDATFTEHIDKMCKKVRQKS